MINLAKQKEFLRVLRFCGYIFSISYSSIPLNSSWVRIQFFPHNLSCVISLAADWTIIDGYLIFAGVARFGQVFFPIFTTLYSNGHFFTWLSNLIPKNQWGKQQRECSNMWFHIFIPLWMLIWACMEKKEHISVFQLTNWFIGFGFANAKTHLQLIQMQLKTGASHQLQTFNYSL